MKDDAVAEANSAAVSTPRRTEESELKKGNSRQSGIANFKLDNNDPKSIYYGAKAEESKPAYVFNFNDIPSITTDVQGIKNLEEAILHVPGAEDDAAPRARLQDVESKLDHGTGVQPKGPAEEYKNYAQDKVRSAFGKADFHGIRSLPNAMSPNFREQLYQGILELTKREQEVRRMTMMQRGEQAMMATSANGSQASTFVGPGQKATGRFSALPKEITQAFSTFPHMSSPYTPTLTLGRDLINPKTLDPNAEDFVVRTIVRPQSGACAFESVTRQDPTPFVDRKTEQELFRAQDKSFRPTFTSKPWIRTVTATEAVSLQGRASDCYTRLSEYCAQNWPLSFSQLFEDESGCVVAVFDTHKAEQEGDLTAFMAQMAATHDTVVDFKLLRDASRWGLLDDAGVLAYYVFWPPWVAHRQAVPEHLKGQVPRTSKLLWESDPPMPSSRVPFTMDQPNCIFDGVFVKGSMERTFAT